MDSMTQDELKLKNPIDDSRKKRIAMGAGVWVIAITTLLDEFRNTKKIVEQVGGLGLEKNGGANFMNMMKNPKQMQQMMGNKLDPKLMQQFGGMENMMQMMKSMGNMEKGGGGFPGMEGGMPDMSQMQEMMKGMGGMGGMGNM